MTLENLLAIHRLQAFEPTPAGRNLADALLAHTRQWLQHHRPELLDER